MSLQAIVEKIANEPVAKEFFSQPTSAKSLYCPPGLRPALAAAAAQTKTPNSRGLILYVTASGRAAEQAEAEISGYMPQVARFPSWETLPHERLSPRADTMAQRIAVLRRLVHPEKPGECAEAIRVLIAPIRALLQPVIAGLSEIEPLKISEGEDYPLDKLAARLLDLGYEKTDLVASRGQFALRGGILDVFVPGEPHPQRLDFFGDTLEEVNYFSLSDQRTIEESTSGVWAPACRELLLTDQVKQRASELQSSLPGVADMLELISQGIPVQGMESLAPVLVGGLQTVTSLLSKDTTIVIDEPGKVARRAADLLETSQEFEQAAWQAAAGGGKIPIHASRALQSLNDFNQEAREKGLGWWELTGLPSAEILASESGEENSANPTGEEATELTGKTEIDTAPQADGLSETTRPTYV
ncbi:MAG: transcription-repair coupling factor, partial [Varibaculum timonense]